MLLWVTIGLLIAGIALMVFAKASECAREGIFSTGLTLTVVFGLVVIIEILFLALTYIGLEGDIAHDEQEFEALVYQYEAVQNDRDYTLGHYKLMERIENWNKKLARHQNNQHDFWIGPFIPDIYDDYEYITINMFMKADYEEDEP